MQEAQRVACGDLACLGGGHHVVGKFADAQGQGRFWPQRGKRFNGGHEWGASYRPRPGNARRKCVTRRLRAAKDLTQRRKDAKTQRKELLSATLCVSASLRLCAKAGLTPAAALPR